MKKEEDEKEIESVDELISKLENLKDSYNERVNLGGLDEDVPESLNQVKKDDVVIDEEKERKKIEDSLNLDAEKERQNIENDYINSAKNIENKKKIYESSAEKTKNETKNAYDRAKINAENDALKRGLARSSTAVLSISSLNDSEAREYSNIAKELNDSLTKIEDELASLETKREQSLRNLDITLSKNIQKKLDEKLDELKKEQEKVLEYNNNIEKLEQNYKADREKQLSSQRKTQYEFEQKYGEGIREDIQKEQMDVTLKYLNKLPKSEAIKTLIQSPELARLLGDYFYDIYYIQSRRNI